MCRRFTLVIYISLLLVSHARTFVSMLEDEDLADQRLHKLWETPRNSSGENGISINHENRKLHGVDQYTSDSNRVLHSLCSPRHVHLSIGRNQKSTHSSMTISFSFSPKCSLYHGDKVFGAVHLWSRSTSLFDVVVIGDGEDMRTYNASLTAKQLKHAEEGESHYLSDVYYHIEIDGLKPETRYFYECLLVQLPRSTHEKYRKDKTKHSKVDYKDIEMVIVSHSDISSFLSPPGVGYWYSPPLDRTIKLAFLGDLGALPHSRETLSKLEEDIFKTTLKSSEQKFPHHDGHSIDCIFLAGDLSYANADHSIWDEWMNMMSGYELFSTIPVQVSLGNHDLDHDPLTLEIAAAYENRFRMPHIQPAIRQLASNELFHRDQIQAKAFVPYEYGNAYYSFIFGPSKHIVLSSYSSFIPGSLQYDWLVTELQNTDRSVTPWLVVMLHCPVYTTFTKHHDEIFIKEARVHLEPLFVKYVVNFVIAGHVHSYMRTVPIADSAPHPKGPIYVIQGNGGRQANEPYLNSTPEEWVEVRDHSIYGYGKLELFNVTHATWKWVKTGYNNDNTGEYEPRIQVDDDIWVMNQLFVSADEYLEDEAYS